MERDDQIALLKRKDMENAQILAAKDKMYEQDAMVRMQLGKRLEQVLMDKEEALENLEMMKVFFKNYIIHLFRKFMQICNVLNCRNN